MNDKIKKQYPTWVSSGVKYDSCLTDDLDSFFSCLLLEKTLNYKITHFYSFDKLYEDITYVKDRQLIGVDMDMVKFNAWGNHVLKSYNPNSANINNILRIGTDTYKWKYAGSVLLQIISYYDLDISMLTEECLMILLAVDTTFKMYGFDKSNCRRYLVDILELPELYKLCEKHKRNEFYNLITKYNLHKKIFINKDGMLQTEIDLKSLEVLFNMSFVLPKNQFKLIKNYTNIGLTAYQYDLKKDEFKEQGKTLFTKAWTSNYYIKLSYY